jgi:hypothetical protein
MDLPESRTAAHCNDLHKVPLSRAQALIFR